MRDIYLVYVIASKHFHLIISCCACLCSSVLGDPLAFRLFSITLQVKPNAAEMDQGEAIGIFTVITKVLAYEDTMVITGRA